jgi:hypothetical protein
MDLVAALVVPDGDNVIIVPPPSGLLSVDLELVDVSQFKGMAMNHGDSEELDFRFGSGSASPTTASVAFDGTSGVATLEFLCEDYGGFATLNATADTWSFSQRLPVKAEDSNLPKNGWKTWSDNDILNPGLSDSEDEDTIPAVSGNPPDGKIGDGLSNYEEFRGFIVREQHRRTNPFKKDLFMSSNLATGISFANNMPVTVHRIWGEDNEPTQTREYGPDREMNLKHTNSGFGGDIPGWSEQKALRGVNVAVAPPSCAGCFGVTTTTTSSLECPNETEKIEVFIDTHEILRNPPYAYTLEEMTNEIRRTFGHEMGHGVHICHRAGGGGCPDPVGPDDSIMSTPLFRGPDGSQPESQYNSYDTAQIRIHENP